jgi:hypothetical protein
METLWILGGCAIIMLALTALAWWAARRDARRSAKLGELTMTKAWELCKCGRRIETAVEVKAWLADVKIWRCWACRYRVAKAAKLEDK